MKTNNIYYKYASPAQGYRTVEYLQSSGTQYIDTGLKGKNYFDLKFKALLVGKTDTGFFGHRQDDLTLRFLCANWQNNFHFMLGSKVTWNIPIDTEVHDISLRADKFIDNGNEYEINYSYDTGDTYSFYLFAANKFGTVYQSSQILYFAKFYNPDTMELVRDYTPCERISDGVLGLYDNITGTFYTNKGSGTFTKGPYIIEAGTEEDHSIIKKRYICKIHNSAGLLKEKETRYFKWVPFEQPILTSNTSSDKMIVSASNEGWSPAWNAFDGNANHCWVTGNNYTTGTLNIRFDRTLYIHEIKLYNRYADSNNRCTSVTLNGIKNTFPNSRQQVSFTFDTPYKTKYLQFYCEGKNWVGLGGIQIIAEELVETDESDYEFTKEVTKYKIYSA